MDSGWIFNGLKIQVDLIRIRKLNKSKMVESNIWNNLGEVDLEIEAGVEDKINGIEDLHLTKNEVHLHTAKTKT